MVDVKQEFSGLFGTENEEKIFKILVSYALKQSQHVDANLSTMRPVEKQYLVYYTKETEPWAKQLNYLDDEKFVLAKMASMTRFPDGTLNGQLYDLEYVRDRHVLYLASFSSYPRLYEDYAALVVLCQSFPSTVTIVLPFFPSGTMERVDKPGQIATANIDAWMLTSLPNRSNRFILLDLHALQCKFYFHGTAMADLTTAMNTIPLVVEDFERDDADVGLYVVAFPDDGACKRFGDFFEESRHPRVICGKVRDGAKRIVTVQEGHEFLHNSRVLIIDDLVQSGGTLIECMKKCFDHGAREVSAFVTHSVFPRESWKRFVSGEGARLKRFYTTDSRPTVISELRKHPDRFTIIPITPILNENL